MRAVRVHWVVTLVSSIVLSSGCGRIGFDPTRLAPLADGGKDASTDMPDASESGGAGGASRTEAGSGGSSQAGSGGTAGTGAAAGSDAAAGSSAVPDAGRGIRDAAMDASRCPGALPRVVDYCVSLPALAAPPAIDGVLDCGLRLAPITEEGWTNATAMSDVTAEYAVAWRADGIYFFVRVYDSSFVPAPAGKFSYEGDGVELFVDADGLYTAPPKYDSPGARQMTIAAPASAVETSTRAELWSFGNTGNGVSWTSTEFRVFGEQGGYIVEAFVTAADLELSSLSLASGATVGMDLSIDVSRPSAVVDAGPEGNRLGQYFLHVAAADAGVSLPPFDERAFCRPELAP